MPTAAKDQLPNHTVDDDVFRINPTKKKEFNASVNRFYQALLQLDKKQSATNIYQLKEQFVTNPKFPWRTMCIKLSEVNMLIGFFRDYVSPKNKSIRNIVDKIEFFDDENDILKEEPKHEDFKKHIIKENHELRGC